jgi:hypothetical protein
LHAQYEERLLAIPARDWEDVTPEQATHYQAISGHYPYGVAEDIWGLENVRYVTFLRDPAKRVASLYSYIRARGNAHRAYQQVSGMTVQEFAERGPFDNGMTRMLAGRYDFQWFQNKEPVTEDDLHLATKNLERIWFVGNVATFRADVYRLADRLDWGPFVIPHINASMSKPRVEPTAAFQDKWWADLYLYEQVASYTT